MVFAALRWNVPPRLLLSSILLGTLGTACSLTRDDVTGQPWENGLNWIPDPAPTTSRDHSIEKLTLSPEPERPKEKENHPPCISPTKTTQEAATQADEADTAEASSSSGWNNK